MQNFPAMYHADAAHATHAAHAAHAVHAAHATHAAHAAHSKCRISQLCIMLMLVSFSKANGPRVFQPESGFGKV